MIGTVFYVINDFDIDTWKVNKYTSNSIYSCILIDSTNKDLSQNQSGLFKEEDMYYREFKDAYSVLLSDALHDLDLAKKKVDYIRKLV